MSHTNDSLRFHSRLAIALAAAFAAGTHLVAAHACVILGGGPVKIDGEEVLIVWDAAHHTEHFVRHLSFRDASGEFGFLVPTPSRPTLADVGDQVFSRLFRVYGHSRDEAASNGARGGLHAAAAAAPVTVVQETVVAGLDATVLAATDAAALNAWLGQHHYPSSAALSRYLAPYVARGFYVTAFRFDPVQSGSRFGARALRMSFTTDRPFFPYAEPDDAATVPGRIFRVSVVSGERVTGVVGAHPWTARVGYAHSADNLAAVLGDAVPRGALPAHPWLTTFQEDTSVRARDDLYFDRAPAQTPVASSIDAPIVTWFGPTGD